MKTLAMDKIVTVLNTEFQPYIVQYKNLAAELSKDTSIVVVYPQGMRKFRERKLKELGFGLAQRLIEPNPDTDPIFAKVTEIWERA